MPDFISRSRPSLRTLKNLLLAVGLVPPSILAVLANPAGETVAAGTATFDRTTANLLVVNASDRAVVNWNSFSVANIETTRFTLPAADSAVLNRVTGGIPTSLDGRLESNGAVFLINPSGMVVGPSGVIQTGGGFLGSTLDFSNAEFIAKGDINISGSSTASIVNLGTISALGGDVHLYARNVTNAGTINAPAGTANLAAGPQFLLKADGETSIAVSPTIDTDPANPAATGTGVDNSGTINAARAALQAHGNLYALAIRNTGAVRATGATVSKDGRILLQARGGPVQQNGTLEGKLTDPTADPTKTKGGEITIAGRVVTLGPASVTDASGPAGGGKVRVGGGALGADPLVPNSQSATVQAGAAVKADATNASGTGGDVVIWSDGPLTYAGSATANGGLLGGDGGSIQLASKSTLQHDGTLRANGILATAPYAKGGDIIVTGSAVNLGPASVVNADGTGGGGKIRVGGGKLGADPLVPNSLSATLSAGSTLSASTTAGATKGGDITIWSDGPLTYAATATANGGLLGGDGGSIQLASKSTLQDDGTLRANGIFAAAPYAKGGDIIITGSAVTLGPTSLTEAGGTGGGGNIRVGGGKLGADPLVPNSLSATVQAGAAVKADATNASGAGGDVVIWSDGPLAYAGSATANGGLLGGDGGSIQLASKSTLQDDGTLRASGILANAPYAKGGDIIVTGSAVTLGPASVVNADGTGGGGKIRVGGGKLGADPLVPNSLSAILSAGSALSASTTAGFTKGGDITIWSDGPLTYAATATANGGLLGGDGGSIQLASKSTLQDDGTLRANGILAAAPYAKGGDIIITGSAVTLGPTSLTEAGGTGGGGNIRIGGGALGADPLVPNSQSATVQAGAAVKADATNASGAGGDVVIWSDGPLAYAGSATANGGLLGGDGGSIQLASKSTLQDDGTLRASGILANAPYAKGGDIIVTGSAVTLGPASVVNADGTGGGGKIRVGGGKLGADPLVPNSLSVTLSAGSTLSASTTAGSTRGGDITIWSDGPLTYAGSATANGGLLGGDGGSIQLASKSTLQDDGTLRANGILAAAPYAKGGDIIITGSAVTLGPASVTEANGTGDAGRIRIGGGSFGLDPLVPNSTVSTTVQSGALINANATFLGNGGNVTVWSDNFTGFYGALAARGGPLGGRGGMAEISAKILLDLKGTIDLFALFGPPGVISLYFDSINIADSGNVPPALLQPLLLSNSVILQTNPTDGTAAFNASLTLNSTHSLTVRAGGNITVNQPYTTTAVGSDLTLRSGRGSVLVGAPITLRDGNFTALAGADYVDGILPLPVSPPLNRSSLASDLPGALPTLPFDPSLVALADLGAYRSYNSILLGKGRAFISTLGDIRLADPTLLNSVLIPLPNNDRVLQDLSAKSISLISRYGAITQAPGTLTTDAGLTTDALALSAFNGISLPRQNNQVKAVAAETFRYRSSFNLVNLGDFKITRLPVNPADPLSRTIGGLFTNDGDISLTGGIASLDQLSATPTELTPLTTLLLQKLGLPTTFGASNLGNILIEQPVYSGKANVSIVAGGNVGGALTKSATPASGQAAPDPATGFLGTQGTPAAPAQMSATGLITAYSLSSSTGGTQNLATTADTFSGLAVGGDLTIAKSVGPTGASSLAITSAKSGSFSVTATAPGSISATTVSAGQNATLTPASGDLSVASLTTTGGDAILSAPGSLSVTTLSAGGDATLSATSGDITLGNISTTGGDLSVTATSGSITATSITSTSLTTVTTTATASTPSTTTVTSGAAVAATSGATTTITGGSATLSASSSLTVGALSTSLDATLAADSGALSLGETIVAGDLDLSAGTSISQTDSLAVVGSLSLATTSGPITLDNTENRLNTLGPVTRGGDLTLLATLGDPAKLAKDAGLIIVPSGNTTGDGTDPGGDLTITGPINSGNLASSVTIATPGALTLDGQIAATGTGNTITLQNGDAARAILGLPTSANQAAYVQALLDSNQTPPLGTVDNDNNLLAAPTASFTNTAGSTALSATGGATFAILTDNLATTTLGGITPDAILFGSTTATSGKNTLAFSGGVPDTLLDSLSALASLATSVGASGSSHSIFTDGPSALLAGTDSRLLFAEREERAKSRRKRYTITADPGRARTTRGLFEPPIVGPYRLSGLDFFGNETLTDLTRAELIRRLSDMLAKKLPAKIAEALGKELERKMLPGETAKSIATLLSDELAEKLPAELAKQMLDELAIPPNGTPGITDDLVRPPSDSATAPPSPFSAAPGSPLPDFKVSAPGLNLNLPSLPSAPNPPSLTLPSLPTPSL